MADGKDNLLQAVAAFEQTFKCYIAVHDYAGFIRESLPELHYYHLNPYCTAVKQREGHAKCQGFDSGCVQARLAEKSGPFWKLCHHGLLEAVIPVSGGGRTFGVIFAGPFRSASADFSGMLLSGKKPAALPKSWQARIPEIKPVAKSPVIALGALLATGIAGVVAEAARKQSPQGGISRRETIEGFFERNYSRQVMLADLAEHLHLCGSRTSQLLKEHFNKGFAELLNEFRISHAKSLLGNSVFKIETVAAYCGFSDPAYFHRVFRRATGTTPNSYRRRHAVASEA